MDEQNTFKTEVWWTDWGLELVQDTSRIWRLETFKATSGYWVPGTDNKLLGKTADEPTLPEGAIVDNTAWDHEHCALCHETISAHEGYQNKGYTDGKDWVCIECYNTYVAPRYKTDK
jgi:hypothetical protein